VPRVASLAGEIDQSRKSYQDLLALWSDADATLPVLKEARQKYEGLNWFGGTADPVFPSI
jgi:hypothetical protein